MVEVADKSNRRGRPPGKIQVWREACLRLHDLSFARAVLQGLAPAAAAQRYLPEVMADERVASAYLRSLMQSAAEVLKSMGVPEAARTVQAWQQAPISEPPTPACCDVTTGSFAGEVSPSLDEFAEEIGVEDFSEREILKLYQERYGERACAPPAMVRAMPSTDAVLRALGLVQSRGLVLPKPTDPVRLWFSDRLTKRLVNQQIELLQDLVAFINTRGRRWFSHVPGLGQDRARRLVDWVVQHEPYLELKIATRSRWDVDRAVLFPAVVAPVALLPGAAVAQTEPLGGFSLRGIGANATGAIDDAQALEAWLETLSFKSPNTRTAYARDAQRLLFWAGECGKSLSTLTVADAAEHARFLLNPPRHWVGVLPARRQDADWRPMRGALSEASAARALAAIGHLYGFLVETGYLVANPFARIRNASSRAKGPRIDTTRSFRSVHLQMLIDVVRAMADDPTKRRARALLMLMASTGVRIGELGGTWGDVIAATVDIEGAGQHDAQCLRVVGKGGKERLLPLKPSVLVALQRHLDDRHALEQQGLLPTCPQEKTPLISVVGKTVGPDMASPTGGLSTAGIHRVIKSLCQKAANRCADPRLQAEFRSATAHWMRHAFAHEVLRASGGDLPVTQQLLGHASLATTGVYVKANLSNRHSAVMAMNDQFIDD